ncbi:MAG TPA: RcnB family protein [Phenylobacterium sp.]|jgi:Ni/Co efflux regulator RcnB|nr:RcnB family protein [Phenylobacterium sp.]
MKRLLTGALALTLLTGTAAMAQPDHRDDQRGQDQQANDHRGADQRQAQHHWGRGERLPTAYYQDRSHDVDYRAHHLRAPPRGYRWVQTDDNNFAMVALTTGLIASIIASNH